MPCISGYCHYRVANEKSIEREIQRWDKKREERKETKKCPPDDYSREKNYADFKKWICEIEEDKYQIWKDNLITRFMFKEKKSGLCQAYHEEDEENQENESDFQDRHKSI